MKQFLLRNFPWILSGLASVILLLFFFYPKFKKSDEGSVKIGILCSLTGDMAEVEIPLVNATQLAIDEINNKGGVIGRQIEAIVYDGASDSKIFAEGAERLLSVDKVSTIFGCSTDVSLNLIKPYIDANSGLLFYPYETTKVEDFEGIVYLGAVPNQQTIPAITWCIKNIGKRIFLIGSDYDFSKNTNVLIKKIVTALGGQILGEKYIENENNDVKEIVRNINEAKPDVVINTIKGRANKSFLEELKNQNIASSHIPVMSLCIGEVEMKSFGIADSYLGHYVCWNYLQGLENVSNKSFIEKYKKKYGEDSVISDHMVLAYIAVYLWYLAAEEINSVSPIFVKNSIKGSAYDSPMGMVYLDINNFHLWKGVSIGKCNAIGQFDVVWSLNQMIRPVSYSENSFCEILINDE